MTTSTNQFYQKPMKMTTKQAITAILKLLAVLLPVALVLGIYGRALWECAKLGFNLFGLL